MILMNKMIMKMMILNDNDEEMINEILKMILMKIINEMIMK